MGAMLSHPDPSTRSYPRHNRRWAQEEREELFRLLASGCSAAEAGDRLGRSGGAVGVFICNEWGVRPGKVGL